MPPPLARRGQTGFLPIPARRTAMSTTRPTHFPYTMETVFNRLEDAKQSWRVYFHDIPQSATLARLWGDVADAFPLFRAGLRARRGERQAARLQLHRTTLFHRTGPRLDAKRSAPATRHLAWRSADRSRLQCGAWRAGMEEHAADRDLRRTWRLLRPCGSSGGDIAGRADAGRLRLQHALAYAFRR